MKRYISEIDQKKKKNKKYLGATAHISQQYIFSDLGIFKLIIFVIIK